MQNIIIKGFVALLIFISHTHLFAQTKLTYISSESAINKGIKAHDKESYKTALKYFNKVHDGDTNYIIAQYEICNTYLAMEEYQKAIDIAEVINSNPNSSSSEFYNLIGTAYDELGNSDKAIEVYTKAINEFPTFYRTYYNRAVTYERINQHDNAVSDFQQTLILNPYHTTSLFKLGELALAEGELAKAMLCFNSYLMMEPENNTDFLAKLNDYVQGDFDESPLNTTLSTDDYEDLNTLLLSKNALKSSYNTPNKLELAIVKQNYLLFTELQNRELSNGFWDTFFAPFYIQIMQRNKFNNLIYYILQSSTNNGIVKILDKNLKKINDFPNWAGDLWQSSHSVYIKNIEGKVHETNYSWLDGSTIESWSTVIDEKPQGYTEYYHYNGRLNATGEFNLLSEQEGNWIYYYNTGELAGVENYKNGKILGADSAYWKNGVLKSSDTYKNGKTEGLSYSFYESGATESKMNYSNSLADGNATYFYENGLPHYKANYINGVLDGSFIEYAPNQQIIEKVDFENDARSGFATEFYINGNKKSETNYEEGVVNGAYQAWYHNGNLKEKGIYKKGVLVGEYISYNPNGSISSIANYDESGKETGVYQEFDKAGKLNVEITYKKGEMTAYKIYHRDGSLIKESAKSNKAFLFENFYSDGTRRTTGVYEPGDVGKNGIWKFYDKNGIIENEEHYSNGKLNGQSLAFYANGQKQNAINYTNDMFDGYSVEYFQNGKMQSQGFYINDLLEGVWKYYQEDGIMKAENFYIKGKMNGPQLYYNVDGTLDLMETYNMNQLVQFELFDTAGVSYQIENTTPDSASYTVKSFTGATLRVFSRKYYITHGPSINYHGNGEISKKGNYFFNTQHGIWETFHSNGELEKQGEYSYDKKVGKWTTFNNEGVLVEETDYLNGQLHGFNIGYHDNGELDYKIPYEYGSAHGMASYYDGNGSLQFFREYYYGKIIGHAYLDKDSQPVEIIPVINETGTFKCYFPNGNISREFEMKNGEFIGDYSEYFENGQLMSKTLYKKGLSNGERTEYWDNGNLMRQENYVDGYKIGIFSSFNKEGKLIKSETYLVNELNGVTTIYTVSGDIKETINYFDGVLIID